MGIFPLPFLTTVFWPSHPPLSPHNLEPSCHKPNYLFLLLWLWLLTKWLENWYWFSLACTPLDLLMTFCILRPFKGTYGPRSSIPTQKYVSYLQFISNCDYGCWPNDLKIGTDILWHVLHQILKWVFSIPGRFEALMDLDCPFRHKISVIFAVYLKLWLWLLTKWLENWYRYSLACTPSDLLMTFCVLRPFRGTFGLKTNFRGQKMARAPNFYSLLRAQICTNQKNFWGIWEIFSKSSTPFSIFLACALI